MFKSLKQRALVVVSMGVMSMVVQADISEADEREAAIQAHEQADKLLNQAYRKAISVMTGKEVKALRSEQNSWIIKRDAKADQAAASLKGTNMYNRERNETLRRLTILRYAELLNLYYDNYAMDLFKHKLNEGQ